MIHTRGDETDALPRPDLDVLETGLFDFDSGKVRVGRCARCGTEAAPPASICHHCGSVDIDIRLDEGVGSLYSYTTIHVSPSRPTPYVVGYIDLPGNVRVLGPVQAEADDLRCDLPVRAAALDAEANDWAFVPAEGVTA